jgi:hypothetical protein
MACASRRVAAGDRRHGPRADALAVARSEHAHVDVVHQPPDAGDVVAIRGAVFTAHVRLHTV